MVNHCPKCKQKLQGTDFLCPRCGHILGQAVYTFPKQKTAYKIPWRQILTALGILMLMAAMAAGAWMISNLPQTAQTTVPTTAPTEVPTVSTRLISYHVQLTAQTDYWIKGTTVHFCKDGKELYSGQVEDDGRITFIAPKGEGYSIRFSNLFPALDFHYGDMEIPFSEGSNQLSFHLENKDVQYTVRVVNTAGEPVPDVKVGFVPQNGQSIQYDVTDSDGLGEFIASYDPDARCMIVYLPNEYVMLEYDQKFEFGSFVQEIVVRTYEECNIDAEHIFTVNFRDEYGAPVKEQFVFLYGQKGDDASTWQSMGFTTNQQGSFTFAGDPEYTYKVRIINNPDYSDKHFTFEEGSNELNVELYLHTPLPEYTYTIKFQDQNGDPIEGVKIARGEGENLLYYTSDQDGVVSFATNRWDPLDVTFMIAFAPAGYKYTSGDGITEYSFPGNSRDMVIELTKETVEYYIFLYWKMEDGNDAIIASAEFDIIIDGKRYPCKTDFLGKCRVELPRIVSMWEHGIEFTRLPEKYASFSIYDMQIGENESISYISIRIGPKQAQQAEYQVTVYVPVNDRNEPVQGVRLHLIYDGERYACETDTDGSCWPPLPEISDISQLQVELISLPEEYEDYIVWDYRIVESWILIFLGPPPEPPG